MRIGIDLGGTKIEGIALDDSGRELARKRVATPVGDYQGTLNAIKGLIQDIEDITAQQGSIGIGTGLSAIAKVLLEREFNGPQVLPLTLS